MNKNELIASIAAATGPDKTDSAKALDAFINSVAKSLKDGKEVRLVGFWYFRCYQTCCHDRPQSPHWRSYQNPCT